MRLGAEKTKALLADAIAQGALGRPLPKTLRNERRIAAAILVFWSLMHGLTLLLVGPSPRVAVALQGGGSPGAIAAPRHRWCLPVRPRGHHRQ
jgi:hypothetical protein